MPIFFYTDNYFLGRHFVSIEFFGNKLCVTYESAEFDKYKIVEIETLGM